MGPIIGMGAVILFTIALGLATAYVLYRVLTNFPPGKSRMQKDLYQLKAEIAPWFGDLIPWDSDEMEKLSLNQINRKMSKGIVTSGKGVFTSIYHEPMIAYAFKKYVGSGKDALLYARTSHHEYAFRIKGDTTEVWMDSEPLGRLRADGSLVSPRNQLLAKINRKDELKLLPISVNNKEVGSLINPQLAGKVNPRALEYLAKMQPDEEAVLLSLAILEMAKPKISK